MSLFAFQTPAAPRWPLAVQAALAVSVPIAVMSLFGHPQLGYVAAAGAFTVLFKSTLPTVDRVRVLPLVALALAVCGAAGALVAPFAWAVAIGLIVVTVAAAWLVFAAKLGAPGTVFFVLVFGLSTQVVKSGGLTVGEHIAAIAAGCVFSYLLTFTPFVFPTARAARPQPWRALVPRPGLDRRADDHIMVLRSLAAAVVGVLLGLVVDPDRTYWIVGTAVAVIGMVPARRAAFQRGTHRVLGTLVGAAVYAPLALLHPSGLWLALILGVLQFGIELIVVRHYALALILITPLVLLLTGAATGELGSMDVALVRLIDTGVGAALGMLSGFLHPKPSRPVTAAG